MMASCSKKDNSIDSLSSLDTGGKQDIIDKGNVKDNAEVINNGKEIDNGKDSVNGGQDNMKIEIPIVHIDSTNTFQTIESFGTSGCWWSQYVGKWDNQYKDTSLEVHPL